MNTNEEGKIGICQRVQKIQSKLIVTEISEAQYFYLAEEYHQLYINKTGLHCHI